MSALMQLQIIPKSKQHHTLKAVKRTVSPKRTFFYPTSNKSRHRNASLTAEAALVFPLFFFFFYLLWQYFLLLLLQLAVCKDVTAIALEYGKLGYIERKAEGENAENLSWAYLPLFQGAMEKEERAENQLVFCTVEKNGEIKVWVRYDFLCEAPMLPKIKIPVTQNFSFFPYLGTYDSDRCAEESSLEAKEDIVYVTEHGQVYHESMSCTYLRMAVRAVALEQVEKERNASGARYTECEFCDDKAHTDTVYVTENGTKYHWGLKCSAISRTVYPLERSRALHLRACSKCGQKKKAGENE